MGKVLTGLKGGLSRRAVLKAGTSAAVAAAAYAAFPGGAFAQAKGPETKKAILGYIALMDAAPLIIAKENGIFAKYGMPDVEVSKQASWGTTRDNIALGSQGNGIDGAHILSPMPYLISTGKVTQNNVPVPMYILARLNLDSQAISVAEEYKSLKVTTDASPLKAALAAKKAKGEAVNIAMTFPGGTHDLWIRYWLAAGGIDPDKDVSVIVVPPPQMVANMKIGKMDGYCVGEPWNARAIADKIGFTSVTTQDIWKDHPEKVCAFTGDFAGKNPKAVKAVLKGLHEASVWLDDMNNRPEQCDIVSKPNFINCQKEIILGRLQGKLDYGDGRTAQDEFYMHFSKRNCNYPQASYAKWWLTQFRRWGMVTGKPDYDGVATKVMRGDIYAEAMKEIGVTDRAADDSGWEMFDGVKFDPKGDLEAYAKGFAVGNTKG